MKKYDAFPPGVQAFAKRLKEKTETGINEWNCDECNKLIFISGPLEVSLNIFVFADAPVHTTKGLCKACLDKYVEQHGANETSFLN